MEVDHEFLWIPERKKYLKNFVETLFNKLNDPIVVDAGSFTLPLDLTNSFTFKFQTKKEKPQEVRNFDVPIFLNEEAEKNYFSIVELSSDLMQKRLKPLIDGVRHV